MSRGGKTGERQHTPFVRNQTAALDEGFGALQFGVYADTGCGQAGTARDPERTDSSRHPRRISRVMALANAWRWGIREAGPSASPAELFGKRFRHDVSNEILRKQPDNHGAKGKSGRIEEKWIQGSKKEKAKATIFDGLEHNRRTGN